MKIDIRNHATETIDQIQFWKEDHCDAHKILLNGVDTTIEDGDTAIYIRSEAHAEYLIKALQKAIELGNWDE